VAPLNLGYRARHHAYGTFEAAARLENVGLDPRGNEPETDV
jgi:hypothetical protein